MTHADTDDPLLDEEWLAAPTQRSRGRALLVALLAAAVCFLGGALAQKHLGTAETSTGSGPAAGGMQLPQGMPDLAQGGAPTTSTSTTATGDATSVIGSVVALRDGVWIVEDLGGKRHRVAVTDDTTVVRERPLSTTDVKVGDTVDISGDTVTLR